MSPRQLRNAGRSSVWAPSCQDVTPESHAGVGVVSLHGAPLSLPTLFASSFKEFFRLGRAMRVVLPLGTGGIARLFVIYGYQGAESDPEKLVLIEHLLAAVRAEAEMCCSGQPVMLVGDLNADPSAIPSLVKSMSDGAWIDVEKAFATGSGVAPALTCQFQLDDGKGTLRDFALVCPIAMAPTTACSIFSSFTVCSGLWVTFLEGLAWIIPYQLNEDHTRLLHVWWGQWGHGLSSRPVKAVT